MGDQGEGIMTAIRWVCVHLSRSGEGSYSKLKKVVLMERPIGGLN